MVSHEVSGSDPGVAGIQVNCCGVGCMAAGGPLTHCERDGKITNHDKTGILRWDTLKHIRNSQVKVEIFNDVFCIETSKKGSFPQRYKITLFHI